MKRRPRRIRPGLYRRRRHPLDVLPPTATATILTALIVGAALLAAYLIAR